LIGKRTNSLYEAGRRTGAWVKIKLHKEQEFVIGGYYRTGRVPETFRRLARWFLRRQELEICRQEILSNVVYRRRAHPLLK
jgi:ATP-dependent DNA ligase